MTMQYIFTGKDKQDHLQTRIDNRDNHITHLKNAETFGIKILLAGPTLDENEQMNGSIVVFECENMNIATEYWNNDPYAIAKLFESTSIKPYKITLNNF